MLGSSIPFVFAPLLVTLFLLFHSCPIFSQQSIFICCKFKVDYDSDDECSDVEDFDEEASDASSSYGAIP
ncbi:hypothetical protein L873DRAFT_1819627 [Choiromyces venosus 120613-1]|uniref:Uncharacterized protein n=1 Tax=Choiromyces venosus 120613-1 TaxID=1336337 RepID=A0A3N4IZ86_9PEZI|nr:hypothetical protein L873DRAFT_1819627 [Choiromyces venosus 120613-1]